MSDHHSEEQKLEEEIVKNIKAISDVKTKLKTIALNSYLKEKKKFDELLEKEIRELNQKYERLSLPLYEKASEIILGRTPKEEELVDLEKYMSTEEIAKKTESLVENEPLKDFWAKVFKNNDVLVQDIRPKDEEILKTLKKVELVKLDEAFNFELKFYFNENAYFTNEVLTKTFYMKDEDCPIKSVGTDIAWKEGKNITKKTIKKKQKNKKTGQTRVIEKQIDDESFFNFFKSINLEELDKKEGNDDEDEETNLLHDRMDIDLDIARTIIDEAIPYGLEYYLGVKIMNEEDEDDMHDHDDDESSEEESHGKKGGKKRGGKH